MIKSLIILTLFALASCLTPADFEIKNLPGLAEQPGFKQYSGFIEATPGVYIFFWFVESQQNPATDPVLYWTNGGPGSSGLGYGFFTEHGPFRVERDNKTVTPYEYSWNKIANVLYVEQPSGVGFSWSEDSQHYQTNDSQSANDIFYFFINFFDIFTQFQNNDFYITSESYGGHYIPTTAKRIIDGKKEKGGDALFARTKGFLIGNPAIVAGQNRFFSDQLQHFAEYFFHGLIPVHAWISITTNCDFKDYYSDCQADFTTPTEACQTALQNAQQFIPEPNDFLNVLAPVCQGTGELYGLTWNKAYDPCLIDYAPEWIQQAEVLEAIHANNHTNPYWPQDRQGFGYDGYNSDVLPLFAWFKKEAPHWNMEIVSGTADPDCPFTGTLRWVNCLGFDITKDAYDWTVDNQPAGKTIEYDGLVLTTVKGCGHTIPTYCPEPGLEFIKNYLSRTQK